MGGQPSDPAKPERWLGEFSVFPGAHQLCTQHVVGQSAGKRVEIFFTLYGTTREPSETTRFYAEGSRIPWRPGSQSITLKRAAGRKILTVQPVSERYPQCGVEPDPPDRTVIIVSEKIPE